MQRLQEAGSKWQPKSSDEWVDAHEQSHALVHPQQECRVLDSPQQAYQDKVNHRISTTFQAPELNQGVDWTVGRKLLGEYKKPGRKARMAALKSTWQGAWCAARPPPSKRKQIGCTFSLSASGGETRTGGYHSGTRRQSRRMKR